MAGGVRGLTSACPPPPATLSRPVQTPEGRGAHGSGPPGSGVGDACCALPWTRRRVWRTSTRTMSSTGDFKAPNILPGRREGKKNKRIKIIIIKKTCGAKGGGPWARRGGSMGTGRGVHGHEGGGPWA